MNVSGPNGDQASSVESSSFDTDDEKDTGREIEIYLTAVLDKAEGFIQDWKVGSGPAIVVLLDQSCQPSLFGRETPRFGSGLPVSTEISLFLKII